MRVLQIFVVSLALIIVFTTSTTAQIKKAGVISKNKIAVINSESFEDEQSGIKDLLFAYDRMITTLKPQIDELKTLTDELKELQKEILRLEEISEKERTGHSTAYSQAKVKLDEYQKLGCKFEETYDRFKELREKRKTEIVAPAIDKIVTIPRQFGKQNGYSVILDKSKDNYSAIIESEAVDVTREFIQFYNDYSEKEKTQ